jgi:hypothetical protein
MPTLFFSGCGRTNAASTAGARPDGTRWFASLRGDLFCASVSQLDVFAVAVHYLEDL